MTRLFIQIVNSSICAAWLVPAVVLLRCFLKKAPRWITPVLWGLVGLRLIWPFSIESAVSLLPSAQTISPEIVHDPVPSIHTGIATLNSAVNPILSQIAPANPEASANPLQLWFFAAELVWLSGIVLLAAYGLWSSLRLRRRVAAAVRLRENIYETEHTASPFVLGLVRPRIYLPLGMTLQDAAYVIAHEQAHLRRRDHWWKPLGYVLLTVHWFNPLLWAAYALLCRDIELACDEQVIRNLEREQRADYSQALLACSIPRRWIAACPLAFGEVGVKARIYNVLHYKKPAFWIILASAAACIALAVCFLTVPQDSGEEDVHWDTRPTLMIGGVSYVDPYMPVSELPHGYDLAGELTQEQANDTGLAGCQYYLHPMDSDSFYVYQECGTPIDINTVDTMQRQWAYKQWIREDLNAVEYKKLTLDDVVRLAELGDALSWEDFASYAHVDTGSGLHIEVYEIDEMFTLAIGGTPTKKPMYVYLHASDQWDMQIDIRTEDVEAFIEVHRGNTVVKNCGYGFQSCEVGYKEDAWETLALLAMNQAWMQFSSIQYLPLIRVDSTQELAAFQAAAADVLDFDRSLHDAVSFREAAAQFDDAFFETTTLFLVYLTEDSTSIRHGLDYVRLVENTLSIGVQREIPDAGDQQMAGWLLCVSVPRDQIRSVTAADALVSSTHYPDRGTANAELIRAYVYEDSQELMKPTVALYDNGYFQFTFSALSSYIGVGEYKLQNERLYLATDDGYFVYVFDIVDDTLVFDGRISSEMVWFSDIIHGAVFR